ncbi:MAG: hypothetical protein KGS72_15610 [Cyanobacteria bacterium REEB67]|nr:hypothetical protein [Cyanobacteria bacterium REEB67]
MEKGLTHFSFKETLHTVLDAAYSVFCHIIFDWAVHGLLVAAVLVIASLILASRHHRLSRPFMAIARRLAIFSAIVAAPGLFTLATTGALPAVGVYNINSIGYICFWSLICAHALGEETNYQLVVKAEENPEELSLENVSSEDLSGAPALAEVKKL